MTQLFSIICTVKNGEETLSDTIDSVINQTYENWELIIVDDGSSDNTREILRDYKKKDERIIIIHSAGMGRAKALNKAISYAKGKYVCNIDADDLFHPEKLFYQSKVIEENPHYFLLATESLIIHGNEQPIWESYNKENEDIRINDITDTILIKNQINHSSVIMNIDVLNELGRYNEKRKSQFDYELWLRAFSKQKRLGKVNYALTVKRIHENQSYENKKRLVYLYRSVKLQLEYICKYKKRFYYILLPPIRLFLGLLPFKLRKSINKLIK